MPDAIDDWLLYWCVALVLFTVLAWNARAGARLREQRTARAVMVFVRDVVAITSIAVALFGLVTEGRGCRQPSPCVCANDDWNCIDRFCR